MEIPQQKTMSEMKIYHIELIGDSSLRRKNQWTQRDEQKYLNNEEKKKLSNEQRFSMGLQQIV